MRQPTSGPRSPVAVNKYLLPREVQVATVRQHPAVLIFPSALTLGGLLLAGVLSATYARVILANARRSRMVAEGSWSLVGKNALSYAEHTGVEERIAHSRQQTPRDSSGEVTTCCGRSSHGQSSYSSSTTSQLIRLAPPMPSMALLTACGLPVTRWPAS